MEENPFAAPQAPAERASALAEDDPRTLRLIARYQRGLIACVLTSIALLVLKIVLPIGLLWFIALSAVHLLGMVFVVLLTAKLIRGPVGYLVGLVFGLLAFFPVVGLFSMLLVNVRATRTLKQNGIPVGFLGTRPDDLSS